MTRQQAIEYVVNKIGPRAYRDDDGEIYMVEHKIHGFGGRYIWTLDDYISMYKSKRIKK